jgi:hypothetical protein
LETPEKVRQTTKRHMSIGHHTLTLRANTRKKKIDMRRIPKRAPINVKRKKPEPEPEPEPEYENTACDDATIELHNTDDMTMV